MKGEREASLKVKWEREVRLRLQKKRKFAMKFLKNGKKTFEKGVGCRSPVDGGNNDNKKENEASLVHSPKVPVG